jgi:hypothetical protein
VSNPRWINTCERNPGDARETHVIQVDTRNNINRSTGRYENGNWLLRHGSPPWEVVAWLESEWIVADGDAQKIPLDGIRTPYPDPI